MSKQKYKRELCAVKARLQGLPKELRVQYAEWYGKQARWHKRARRNNPNWKWHAEQQVFYESARARCLTSTEIMQEVFRKNLRALASNVAANNVLFRKFFRDPTSR